MRIEVTGKGLDLTEAITQYADSKCQKLLKFFDGVMEIDIILATAEHGDFSAEIVVDVVKHDRFVAHARDQSVYACIDEVVAKMSRQIREFKEKLRSH